MNDRMSLRLIRTAELVRVLGISRTSIWRLERDKKIPKPVRFGSRMVGWLQSDIDQWLQNQRGNQL